MTRKLNNIRRTATFAWSPGQQLPMIATGTMAGALDDSFSNASELEIFKLDLNPDSNSLETSHKVSTTSRFNTLAWGHASTEKPYGVIAGAMETGELELWDPSVILDNKSASEALILRNSTHTGKLCALDFNLFQTNLLASAGSNSEVYIWDLNNPTTPFTPGAKSSKMDDISSVAWNCQVQHIVSTASTNGYTVVWDLRNKKEVMTLAYAGQNTITGGRGTISSIAWNPDVATQIVTASDDDQNPIISLWDLRHAHSPEKILAGHTKGVLDISWCRQDSDLLISSGKDCKTLCWNPNTGELNGELSSNNKWTFEVDWCPRNPDLLASSSFDGSINVFSIQGAQEKSNQAPISDDPFDAAILAAAPSVKTFELLDPPKWLRRPVGASFGFSGKLVTFNNKLGQAAMIAASSAVPGQSVVPNLKTVSRAVKIITIETDPEIMKRSEQLESATENNVDALIEDRIQHAGKDKVDWEVLKTLFSENAREQLMTYLGFEKDQVMAAANALLGETKQVNVKTAEMSVENSEDGIASVPTDTISTFFGESTQVETPDESFFGQVLTQPPVAAPLIEAVLKSSRPFDLYPDGSSDTDRLITRAIVLGDFESAVNVCIATKRFSDALILAICGGSELLARTQKTYFETQSKKFAYLRLLEGIVEDDLSTIVQDADLKEWASVLVVLCTFAQSKDFGPLCEVLGDRLLKDAELSKNATLFYLAAGNLEKVSSIWISQFEQEENNQDSVTFGVRLQELVEKVTIFRKAIDFEDTAAVNESGDYVLANLYDKYCQYAEFMATQGKLDVALKYISLTPAEYANGKARVSRGSIVHDRVFHASASQTGQYQKPSFPFEKKLLSSKQEVHPVNVHPVNVQKQNAYQPTVTVKSPVPAVPAQPNYYAPTAAPQQQYYGQQNYNQKPTVTAATANVGYNNYAPNTAYGQQYAQPQQQYVQPQQQQYTQPEQQYTQLQQQQYTQPQQQYTQPQQQYTQPPSQQYGQVPAQYGSKTHAATASPPPPPPKGAWNDPPMLASPKMNKKVNASVGASAIAAVPGKRVTTPFANSPIPQALQQQTNSSTSGPPMNTPPMRGLSGPPPPPSSNTTIGYYSAHQQPQQFQAPPPPMNAVAPSPMMRGRQ